MRKIAFLILFNTAPFFATGISASAWTLEEGTKRLELAFSWTGFDKVKLYNGQQKHVGQVNFYTQSVKLFYGMRDNVSLFIFAPHQYTTRVNQTSFNSLGDAKIGIQIRLFDEADAYPLTLGLRTKIKLPLSDYEVYAVHALGDGQVDIEGTLVGGRMGYLQGHQVYISSAIGYRIRKGKPSNDVLMLVEMGGTLNRRLSLRGFIERLQATSGLGLEAPEFHDLRIQNSAPPFPDVQEIFTKAGLSLSVLLTERLNIEGFYARTLQYKNTSEETHSGLHIGFNF